MKVEVQTQILSTETLSKVNILSVLELIELFRTNGKMSIFKIFLTPSAKFKSSSSSGNPIDFVYKTCFWAVFQHFYIFVAGKLTIKGFIDKFHLER